MLLVYSLDRQNFRIFAFWCLLLIKTPSPTPLLFRFRDLGEKYRPQSCVQLAFRIRFQVYFLKLLWPEFSLQFSCRMASSKEKGEFTNQNALDDAVSYFNRGFEILTREASRVREEKEAFDSVSKKMKEGHFGKTVRLNIGGQYFTTSVHTLTKDPGSMLNAMFSGRFETQPSEDGSFFIDRDGTYFRYILNYLRTGKLLLPNDELVRIWDELLAEAEYYQIQGIVDDLTSRANCRAEPKFHESVILNSDQAVTLVSWLPREDSELGEVVLLYRASRDGWNSFEFHRQCDDKGPTITVVKVGTNLFGGYTEQSWDGTCSFFDEFFPI